MSGIIRKIIGNRPIDETAIYPIFRILVSLMFFQHGIQKFLGAFGGVNGSGAVAPLGSIFWWAGLIEMTMGALIFFGVFSRLAAAVAIFEMIAAYFIVHIGKGLVPILNGGELVILFIASFLVVLKCGSGRLSLERTFREKELF